MSSPPHPYHTHRAMVGFIRTEAFGAGMLLLWSPIYLVGAIAAIYWGHSPIRMALLPILFFVGAAAGRFFPRLHRDRVLGLAVALCVALGLAAYFRDAPGTLLYWGVAPAAGFLLAAWIEWHYPYHLVVDSIFNWGIGVWAAVAAISGFFTLISDARSDQLFGPLIVAVIGFIALQGARRMHP